MPSDASQAPAPPRRKVAVLGGGIAGLTAALALTATEADRARFEVTVHQLGWRLGGKCASGREPAGGSAARVLEHGLHIFAGFYHNAFALLRGCYDELGGAGGVPAKAMFDAFRPKNEIVLIERVGSRLVPWPIDFLETEGVPGEGPAVPTVAEFVESLLAALVGHLTRGGGAPPEAARRAPPDSIDKLPEDLARRVRDAVATGDPDVVARHYARDAPPSPDDEPPERFALHHAALVAHAGARGDDGSGEHLPHVVGLLGAFEADAGRWVTGAEDWFRRLRLGANLVRAVVAGIHGDDVTAKGFDHLDAIELKDWLRRWGAGEETVAWAPVNAGYDYAFAYEGGDETKPLLGAGTGLRGFLRLLFAYKGAIFWEMLGSMGEVVVLPMYLALLRRGVRFEFFSRVDALTLDAAGARVEAIRRTRQVRLSGPAYDPLVPIGLRKAWPPAPLWDQIAGGPLEGVDLESPFVTPEGATSETLTRGEHFDDVVLAVSVAEAARITPALSAASPAWKAMVEGVATCPTIALQLWTVPTLTELGWPHPDRVATVTPQPLSTFSDMSFLAEIENWPADSRPGAVIYFCGQLPEGEGAPTADPRALAVDWLRRNAGRFLPNGAEPKGPTGVLDAALFAPPGVPPDQRFAWQYCRANVAPSERYVQSAPGTLALRLRPGGSGFGNLVLAGDWTRNGVNAGCVEAAVMSGLQAARALRGDAAPVPGESDV